jgi:hypothetical protein
VAGSPCRRHVDPHRGAGAVNAIIATQANVLEMPDCARPVAANTPSLMPHYGTNSGSITHPMVINSIEDESGVHCVDVTGRPDGKFSYKVFRKDPEDQGRWTLVADHSALHFQTEDEAFREAATRIPWLADKLPGRG